MDADDIAYPCKGCGDVCATEIVGHDVHALIDNTRFSRKGKHSSLVSCSYYTRSRSSIHYKCTYVTFRPSARAGCPGGFRKRDRKQSAITDSLIQRATGGISNASDATLAVPSLIATQICSCLETVLSSATIARIAVTLAVTKSRIWLFSPETRHFARPASDVATASARLKICGMQGLRRAYFA